MASNVPLQYIRDGLMRAPFLFDQYRVGYLMLPQNLHPSDAERLKAMIDAWVTQESAPASTSRGWPRYRAALRAAYLASKS